MSVAELGHRALALLPLEVDEYPPEIARVLLHAVVLGFDLFLVQETKDPFLQLTRSLPRDDLHYRRFRPHRLFNDFKQSAVDVLSAVVDVVEVEFEFHRIRLEARSRVSEASGGSITIEL